MRKRLLWAAVGVFAAACLAAPAQADLIDTTIPDIQDTSSALRDTLTAADTVRVEGVITGADTKASGFGFYIEDGTFTLYRGILVFTGGANTFADSGLARGDRVRVTGRLTEFGGGTEIISQTGSAFGTPPIVVKLGSEAIPGPTDVSPGDIARNGVLSEQYEGMYCNMNTTMRVGTSWPTDPRLPGFSMLCVEDVGASLDTVLVDMSTLANPSITPPPAGTVLTLLRGIVDQRSLGYNLQVRDGNDVLLPTPPNLVNIYAVADDSIRVLFDRPMDETTTEDVSNYSRGTLKSIDAAILQADGQSVHLVCTTDPQVSPELEEVFVSGVKSSAGATMTGTQSDQFIAGITPISEIQAPPPGDEYNGPLGSDTTQFLGQTVTTRGTVTARDGSLVWIQDSAGGLRSGFKLFAPGGPMVQGDDITLVGVPIEFFDETEFSGSFFERNHGPGVMPPPVLPATLAELNALAGPPAREDYEHILVELDSVAVSATGSCFGAWVAKLGGPCYLDGTCADTVDVSDRLDENYAYEPSVGDQFSSLTGVIEVGNPGGACYTALRLVPRQDSDIVPGPVVTGTPAPRLEFALRTPEPNPVSLSRGGAEISFTLPQAGAAQVRLYDLRGRLVADLAGGEMLDPGPHTVRWNGRDAGGAQVGPGIYFVQLKLGNAVAATKLVVAE